MKNFILIIVAVLLSVYTNAQSHTYDACCRYGKGPVRGDCICPACAAENKRETEAKAAEDKRIEDITVAKYKAEQQANQEEHDRKQAEEKAKSTANASDNVFYLEPPNSTKKEGLEFGAVDQKISIISTNADPKNNRLIADYVKGKNGWAESYVLKDKKSNQIILQTEAGKFEDFPSLFKPWDVGINPNESYSIPDCYLIFFDNYDGDYCAGWSGVQDLINSKGQRMFNDNALRQIDYCGDGYFFLQYCTGALPTTGEQIRCNACHITNGAKLFNIYTKEYFELNLPIDNNLVIIPFALPKYEGYYYNYKKGYENLKLAFKKYHAIIAFRFNNVDNNDMLYVFDGMEKKFKSIGNIEDISAGKY